MPSLKELVNSYALKYNIETTEMEVYRDGEKVASIPVSPEIEVEDSAFNVRQFVSSILTDALGEPMSAY